MIEKILQPLLNIIRNHKKKLALLLGLYIVFLYLFFPFNDLGDLVAQKVSELTSGQVFVNFDSLGFNILPQPGFALTNVTVETSYFPKLSASSLSLSPSIAGLLSFKPGVSAHAENLLGGNVDFSSRGGDKTAAGKLKQKVNVDLSEVNLSDISDFAQLPLRLTGILSGSLNSQVDLDFTEQPASDLSLKISKTLIPEGQINTQLGPLDLPRTNLGDVVVDGKTEKGSFEISHLVVGKPGGDLYANVFGKAELNLQKVGNSISPRFGGYDFSIHLQLGPDFAKKMSSFLGLLQSYQTALNTYAFRIFSSTAYAPPSLAKIQ